MRELSIRSKCEMIRDVGKTLAYLHWGKGKELDAAIEDLKIRSIYLEEEVQQNVLMFAEQVYFQYRYDPWHRVNENVTLAADRLIQTLHGSAA